VPVLARGASVALPKLAVAENVEEKTMNRLLATSIYILCILVTPVCADPVTIGFGVVADVTIDLITPRTIVTNIRNTTGVTAQDFHIVFSQGGRVISSFDYSLTATDPNFRMDAVVPNGGFLMVGQTREVLIVNQNVTSINAFWTDGKGNAITPEPATMLLLSTGLVGVAIKMRKKLRSRKSGQGSQ
jgi:hypothetical protein